MPATHVFPESQASRGVPVFHHLIQLTKKKLDKFYSWNNWVNSDTRTAPRFNADYHDRSPTRGDGNIDYAKPVWRR